MLKTYSTFIIYIIFSIGTFATTLSKGTLDYSAVNFDMEYVEIQTADLPIMSSSEIDTAPSLQTLGASFTNSPTIWQKLFNNINKPTSSQFCDYYFTIIIPESSVGKRFRLYPDQYLATSSTIYVNGVLCVATGKAISYFEDSTASSYHMNVSSFTADTSVLRVHAHVNQSIYPIQVFLSSLYFGSEDQIILKQEKSKVIDFFLVFSLLILGIYHLILFCVSKFDRRLLYYALFCMVFSVNHTVYATMSFFVLLPSCIIDLYPYVHLLFTCLMTTFGILMLYSIFSKFIPKYVYYFALVINFIFIIFAICGTESVRFSLIIPNLIFIVLITSYCCFMLTRIIALHVYDSILFISIFYISLFGVCYGIFSSFFQLSTLSPINYALTFFVILFPLVPKRDIQHKFIKAQDLSRELQTLNAELETEVNKRTEELSQSLDKVSKFNHFQEGMTHMIAHDIKGPLMQIVNIDKVREQDFPYLRHSGMTMLGMVDNMMTLYKYNTANMIIAYTNFCVPQVIDEILNSFVYLLSQRALKVEIIYEEVYNLRTDIEIFKRVLCNLLSNAFRFSPNAGLIQIKLASTSDDALKVSVSNQGPPLDEKTKAKLFKQAEPKPIGKDLKNNTSGLGLYLCKMVIDALKGDIGVESDGVQGCEFWFVLPNVTAIEKKNVRKLFVESINLNLSLDEKQYLKPYVSQIENIKVYETSKIEDVLSSITDPNTMIQRWIDTLRQAVYSSDETRLKEILQQVTV